MIARTRSRLALLAVILAMAALVGWTLRAQLFASDAATVAESTSNADAALPAPAHFPPATLTRPRPATTAALPPPDAPLAHILPELTRRADAGDRKAACRLSMELLRCAHLADLASLSKPDNSGGSQETSAREAASMAEYRDQMRLWELERGQQCQHVPESLRDRGGHYLTQAARAGEPEAMVRYAEGSQFPPSGRGIVADPGFEAWRRDAAATMHRALELGAPEAAYILMITYSDDFGFLSGLVPNDPEQALAMNMLYARLFGASEFPHLSRNLSASTIGRAREHAERMHRDYFQGRRFPKDRMMLHPHFYPPRSGTPARYCAND